MNDTAQHNYAGEPIGEPAIVTLTRIEGTLNLVAERISNVSSRLEKTDARVDIHNDKINHLEMSTLQLAADAIARDATVAATAKALREAKEAQDATTRAEAQKADRSWSPFTKVFAFIAAVGIVWGIVGPILAAQ